MLGVSGPSRSLLGPHWGRLGAILARSGSLLGALWGRLGALLNRLGALMGRLGALLRASWAVLGSSGGPFGSSEAVGIPKWREGPPEESLEESLGVIWNISGASSRLGSILDCLGDILWPSWTLLRFLGVMGVSEAPWDRLGGNLGPP